MAKLNGIAIECGIGYLDGLAEAMRLGGMAYHGKLIHDSIGAAEDIANDLFFAELDDLAKMTADGRSEHTN